jgi:hypothetical protein
MGLTHRHHPEHRAGKVICSICGKTRLYPGLQCQRVNADARDRDGKFLRVGEFVCWFHTVREVEGKAAEVAQ